MIYISVCEEHCLGVHKTLYSLEGILEDARRDGEDQERARSGRSGQEETERKGCGWAY